MNNGWWNSTTTAQICSCEDRHLSLSILESRVMLAVVGVVVVVVEIDAACCVPQHYNNNSSIALLLHLYLCVCTTTNNASRVRHHIYTNERMPVNQGLVDLSKKQRENQKETKKKCHGGYSTAITTAAI